jgi:hypothetical protein
MIASDCLCPPSGPAAILDTDLARIPTPDARCFGVIYDTRHNAAITNGELF